MIDKRIQKLQALRWHEVIPGRLLHVQLRLATRCFDVIACYQYVHLRTTTQLQKRKEWLNGLDTYLATLSKRNMLLVAGDFNSNLPCIPAHVGTDLMRWKRELTSGAQHPDAGHLANLVKAHNLCALNTWDASLGPTFFGVQGISRIDYFLTRLATADGVSRKVRYLPEAPFLGCITQGHVPMIAQLRCHWIPPTADPCAAGINAQQREAGRQAFTGNTEAWHHFIGHSGTVIQDFFDQTSPYQPDAIPDLHAAVSQSFSACFPPGCRHSTPDALPAAMPLILNKWKHRALFKRCGLVTQSNLFHAWYHLTRFQVLRRKHQRHAKLVRQQEFDRIIAQAHRAATRHDSFQLFRTINQFSPKQPRRRMQLRNALGSIASPVEELSILTEFVSKAWQGPAQVPMPEQAPIEMPFSEEDLKRALQAIPATKAVARPFTPGLIGRHKLSWSHHHCIVC